MQADSRNNRHRLPSVKPHEKIDAKADALTPECLEWPRRADAARGASEKASERLAKRSWAASEQQRRGLCRGRDLGSVPSFAVGILGHRDLISLLKVI